MAGSSKFPTHLISDDGTRYATGEIVRIDQSSGRIQIVADPEGNYQVVNCRQATEYAGDTPYSGSTSGSVRLLRLHPPIRGHRGRRTTA